MCASHLANAQVLLVGPPAASLTSGERRQPDAGGIALRVTPPGPAVVDEARAEPPDAIVLSLTTPAAVEICRALEADPALRTIPVLVLTPPGADRASRQALLDAGADGFLADPLDELELSVHLRGLARIHELQDEVDRRLTHNSGLAVHDEEERERLHAQQIQAQKMESVGRLAGGVAHDFNNMLGVILGHVELATTLVPADHPVQVDLTEIRRAAERSAELTHQLLAFARKQTVAPRALDLNETVEGMLRMLRRLIGEDVELAWLPGSGAMPVHIDPSQVDQVLANLAVNARDAIAGVGTITIRTEAAAVDAAQAATRPGMRPGDFVVLSVTDTGCGMSPETLARVFEPFFTTKEVGHGTGLGLATVYGIVKQNGGYIYAESDPGTGTVFRVYLPRLEAVPVAGEAPPVRPAASGHETVLLVEDEPSILAITRAMLERLGYTVLAASGPSEALRIAGRAGPIELLLTDVIMPEMNGRELAARLRARHPRMKQLFTSGYPSDVIAHHGVLEEGVHFLPKPFSMRDLAGRVREALDS